MSASDAVSRATTLSSLETAAALETGAVVRWWQLTAFLEVAGPDALALVDGLCTQAVDRIEPGTAKLGLFLDAKARVIAPAMLHRLADVAWIDPRRGDAYDEAPRLLLETWPDLQMPLHAHLTRHRLRARAHLEPADLGSIAVVGAGAIEASTSAVAQLEPTDGAWSIVTGQSRPTRAFCGTADACMRLVTELLPAAGIALADPDALEADRIAAGVAGLHDLLPGRMPAEVGAMAHAVALDAGCYLGQEPVARLHYRGRANRSLRRLEAAGEVVPVVTTPDGDPEVELALRDPDAADDSRPRGRLTTWARRADGSTVALAVLRREAVVGDRLVLAGADAMLRVMDDAPT